MKILAVDDHELFRTGLRHLLYGIAEDMDYKGVGSVNEAIALQGEFGPDLMLLDYFLPEIKGDIALAKIRQSFPGVAVVILSSLDEPLLIRRTIELGAAGFIPKSSILIRALKLILDGGVYLPRHAIYSQINDRESSVSNCLDDSDILGLSKMTPRQSEVIRGVVKGKPNKIIAHELNISEGTVKSHLSAAFKILGVNNRTQAVIAVAKEDSSDTLD